jgi:quinol monooxygenase YgiN
LPYWQAVVDTTEKEEPGSLLYGICKDPGNPEKLYTIEAYKSEEYLRGVHVKNKAIEESVRNTKHLRTGLKHVFLRLVAGYLWKAGEGVQAQL